MSESDFDASESFVLVVHDVAPVFRRQLAHIQKALAPIVGARVSAAVVPCWRGGPLSESSSDADFLGFVTRGFGEVLQHGYTHHQERLGLISLISGRANEFSGLGEREARERLEMGRGLLARLTGKTVAGFVAPAWQRGRASAAVLGSLGFEYAVGFGSACYFSGPTIPLATWSWDWGVVPGLGWCGEWIGAWAEVARPAALPCIVVHPLDVDRGWLPRSLRVVERLRNCGKSPILFSDIARSP